MNGKQTNSEMGHHKLGIILHLCGYKCLKIPWNVHLNMATLIRIKCNVANNTEGAKSAMGIVNINQ
jgi:hypothetical protein